MVAASQGVREDADGMASAWGDELLVAQGFMLPANQPSAINIEAHSVSNTI
jgi:hypothetical protein